MKRSGSVSLYELLKVPRGAVTKEIKKAYYALARQVHPDKNPDDPNAQANFQALQKAYSILMDPKKRERYDRTGCDDDDNDAFWDAYERFRGVKVTVDDIHEYIKSYQGGDEERKDVIEYYESHSGNIEKILGCIIAAKESDLPRYVEIIEAALANGLANKAHEAMFRETKDRVLTEEELDALEEANADDVFAEASEEEKRQEEEAAAADDENEMAGFIVEDAEDDLLGNGMVRKAKYDSDEEPGEDDEVLCVNDLVFAKWNRGQWWYRGTITSTSGKKNELSYTVKYHDDGTSEKNLPRRHLHFHSRAASSNNNSELESKPSRAVVAEGRENESTSNQSSFETASKPVSSSSSSSGNNKTKKINGAKKRKRASLSGKKKGKKKTAGASSNDDDIPDSLRAAILGKAKNRHDDFVDAMFAKYAGK